MRSDGQGGDYPSPAETMVYNSRQYRTPRLRRPEMI